MNYSKKNSKYETKIKSENEWFQFRWLFIQATIQLFLSLECYFQTILNKSQALPDIWNGDDISKTETQ